VLVTVRGDESGVHDGECIAKEKIGENFNGVAHHLELITLLEQFDEEKDQGGDCIDGQGQ
jgi:hypothetical protein